MSKYAEWKKPDQTKEYLLGDSKICKPCYNDGQQISWEGLWRGTENLSKVIETFPIMIVVTVSLAYAYAKAYQMVHLKYMALIIN